MSKLDDAIREALAKDEVEQLEQLAAPQGIFSRMGWVFRSNDGPWAVYGMVLQFVAFGVAIWAGWNFYFASGREMALWGFLAGLMIMMQTFLKFWFLLQMDKQEILREIKRLELQLALLANKKAL